MINLINASCLHEPYRKPKQDNNLNTLVVLQLYGYMVFSIQRNMMRGIQEVSNINTHIICYSSSSSDVDGDEAETKTTPTERERVY